MDKRLHHSLPKESDLGIIKNCRGKTLTSIAAKLYNALLLKPIKIDVEKIFRKNQTSFSDQPILTTSLILTIRRIIEEVRGKHLEETLLLVDYSKGFDSIHT